MTAIDHIRGCLPGIFSTAHLLHVPSVASRTLVVRGAPHLFVDAYWWASMVIAGACPRILEEEPELADGIGLLYRVVEWVDLHPQK